MGCDGQSPSSPDANDFARCWFLDLILGLFHGGCDSDGTGGNPGTGGSAGGTGRARRHQRRPGGTTGAGNAGTSGGGGVWRWPARGGNTGNGGRGGAGGAATFDGGFPDAFSFDGLNLDAILADAGITTCAASVMSGSACASGTDTGCQRPSGGGFCFCSGAGTWSCF